MKPDSISFEEWVRHVFDHPVKETAWYWQEESVELASAQFISFATKLFRYSQSLLGHFSDAQVNDGLYLLLSNTPGNQIYAVKDEAVPIKERLAFLLVKAKMLPQF